MLETLATLWAHGEFVLGAYVLGMALVVALLVAILIMIAWDSIANYRINRTMATMRANALARDAAMDASETRRIVAGPYRYDRPHTAVHASQAMPTVALRREVRS